MAGGYKALEAGKRYLKNLGSLEAAAADGITQDDLDAAEVKARAVIDGALATVYNVTTWAASPPPLIANIADKLASAEVLMMKFARDGGGPTEFVGVLEETAKEDVERLRKHELVLVDSAGVKVVPLARQRPVIDCS